MSILLLCRTLRFCFLSTKFRQTARLIKSVQEEHDKDFKSFLTIRRQSSRLLERIDSLNFRRLSEDEALTVLIDGGKLLANLTKHWGDLALFFENIETVAEESFSEEVMTLADITQGVGKLSTPPEVKAENLGYVKEALEVVQNAATCLHQISATYGEFSSRFILSDVNALPQLLESDSNIVREARQKELVSCDCYSFYPKKGIICR